MSILINSAHFQLYVVFWPVYQIQSDQMVDRCFRMRIGKRHFPKRKDDQENDRAFYSTL